MEAIYLELITKQSGIPVKSIGKALIIHSYYKCLII